VKNRNQYLKYKEQARILVENRISHFSKFYDITINRIAIRNQKTRWGSCSRNGNLNFNYKLVLIPENLADYVIVHELCHLKQFNHSKNFWNLVAETIPDYEERRESLKKMNREYFSVF
jgi:predicted metal-dependent hydrolase